MQVGLIVLLLIFVCVSMGRLSFVEEAEGDYLSKVTLDPPPHHRRSFHRNSSSLTAVLPFVNSRKSFSYDKLADFPIQLTIIKLDGSSFEIEVTKRATIAELKQAIENYFSRLPIEGPSKISWQHVWGHFCLTYGGNKLLNDGESIKAYGIKDGDELHFVRHMSIDMLVKQRSQKRIDTSNAYTIIENEEEDLQEEDEDSCHLEDLKRLQLKDEAHDDLSDREPDTCNLFKGWFQYSRISNVQHPRIEGTTSSRRWGGRFVGFIRSVFHFCGNRRPAYSSRASQVEI